jgi:hypothetical protein
MKTQQEQIYNKLKENMELTNNPMRPVDTNPPSAFLDAEITRIVGEAVPEIYSDFGTMLRRPIQLQDIMRALQNKCEKYDYVEVYVANGTGITSEISFTHGTYDREGDYKDTLFWNLSLDYAHQEYATRLAIYQLLKP